MAQDLGKGLARRRKVVAATAVAVLVGALAWTWSPAQAAPPAAVSLGTAAQFSVLGASAVTNTNATVLQRSLGVSPGTSITGFPPGVVEPPGTIHVNDAVAKQAQADTTAAYVDIAGRPVDAETPADLAGEVLQAGVYSGPSKGALLLTGTLVLDGGGDATSVFIIQTDSTLTTASGSVVQLVNNAQECNVFWQVGSSATLGTGSTFAGNILALASITVNNSVTVHGRALARTGAVTLDGDRFRAPSCASAPATTTTAAPTTTSTTAVGPTSTSTTAVGPTSTSTTAVGPTSTTIASTSTTGVGPTSTSTTAVGPTSTSTTAVGPTSTSTTLAGPTSTTTTVAGATTTTAAPTTSTTSAAGGGPTSTTAAGVSTTTTTVAGTDLVGPLGASGSGPQGAAPTPRRAPRTASEPLARTGSPSLPLLLLGLAFVDVGVGAYGLRLVLARPGSRR